MKTLGVLIVVLILQSVVNWTTHFRLRDLETRSSEAQKFLVTEKFAPGDTVKYISSYTGEVVTVNGNKVWVRYDLGREELTDISGLVKVVR